MAGEGGGRTIDFIFGLAAIHNPMDMEASNYY